MTKDNTTPPNEKTVLVLQGGGALGAYQAGAYAALHEADLLPDWVSGISIGAINGAIIAGNQPADRVPRLREFWELVSSELKGTPPVGGKSSRTIFNQASAALVAGFGVPGFFSPRIPSSLCYPPGASQALSYYDTRPLRKTIERLVNFDLLESGQVRLSVGAVNVCTGNFIYFDTAKRTLGPEHIMASGALPPGFPPVEIDGELYWDGGLVSNTPLQHVLENTRGNEDMCVFQVDLFSARGKAPETLFDVALREKAIRYSSRTRLNTNVGKNMQTIRRAVKRLLAELPQGSRDSADLRLLDEWSCDAAVTIVHLIHRVREYETQSMDYEFSRLSVEEHWAAGEKDVRGTLRHDDWRHRCKPEEGVNVMDLTRESAEGSTHHAR